MGYCEICGCIGSDWCLDCSLFEADYFKYQHMHRDAKMKGYCSVFNCPCRFASENGLCSDQQANKCISLDSMMKGYMPYFGMFLALRPANSSEPGKVPETKVAV